MENLSKSVMPQVNEDPRSLLRQDGMKRRIFLEFLVETGLAYMDDKFKVIISADWRNKENRVSAVKGLVDILGIKPTDLKAQIFFDNGLTGLLTRNLRKSSSNENSILKIINEAYPKGDYRVWDLKDASKPALYNSITANEAIDWFMEKWCSAKEIAEITAYDFAKNGLGFAIEYYNNNIYVAVAKGYAGLNLDGWRRLTASHMNRGLIEDRLNRECVLDGLKRFSESIYSIKYDDFEAYGIGYVLDYYRSKRYENLSDKSIPIDRNLLVYDALMEMSPNNFDVWRMSNPPHSLFATKENRVGAIKFISYSARKTILNLDIEDYESLGFRWLVDDFYGGDTYSAGVEALSGFLPS